MIFVFVFFFLNQVLAHEYELLSATDDKKISIEKFAEKIKYIINMVQNDN
jgi:hypothetical protein